MKILNNLPCDSGVTLFCKQEEALLSMLEDVLVFNRNVGSS